jgi:hypothetical protein
VEPVSLDSGGVGNNGESGRVVFSETAKSPGAPWLRLIFDDIQLEGGSRLRLTSVFDGDVQYLDSASAGEWSGTSAFFNGDAAWWS